MRAAVHVADHVERNVVAREVRHALEDGAYWAWLVAVVAAAVVWVARDMPDPRTAGGAAAGMVLASALASWRAWRRALDVDERGPAAAAAFRRWLLLFGIAGAIIPAGVAAADHDRRGALVPLGAAFVVLVALAVVTIPFRARARLLARIRIGAAAVAGGDDVRVGRALWSGRHLARVHIAYPPDWAAHRATRRDDLAERVIYDLCGPPPTSPDEKIARPDYLTTFNHVYTRLEVTRVRSLPRRLAARDFGQASGRIVLGQTVADQADATLDGIPVALYDPVAHLLGVGATQHGKSSGVRAWAVDGLTHGAFPGGLWAVDGKGGGALAPLLGRERVHAVAHKPEEWRHVITEHVAPEVAHRYDEMLAWRSGRSTRRPDHPRSLLIIDELQQVLQACPDLAGPVDTLARQALEAGVILWVLTQRPDAKDAVPGAVRDQLVDRVTFGPLSGSGAKMAFDVSGDDWARAMGVAPIPGRALTWLGGRWRPVQVPWMPIPAAAPDAERLYPPHAPHSAAQGAAPPEPEPETPTPPRPRPAPKQTQTQTPKEKPKRSRTWPPPRPASPPPEPPAEPPAAPPIQQVDEILRDFGDEDGQGQEEPAAYDPTDPYAHRRRRRRRD